MARFNNKMNSKRDDITVDELVSAAQSLQLEMDRIYQSAIQIPAQINALSARLVALPDHDIEDGEHFTEMQLDWDSKFIR